MLPVPRRRFWPIFQKITFRAPSRSRVCALHKSVASQPMSMAHPSPQRPLTTAECATVSKTYHSLPLCACLDGRPNPAASRKKHGRDLPQFLTGPSSKRGRRGHGHMPPRSGRESGTPIKLTEHVDGYAFQSARRVLHRYMECSIPPLSQATRRGATLLRRAHYDLVAPQCSLTSEPNGAPHHQRR